VPDDRDAVALLLGGALAGTVTRLERLSTGASRITSAVDLERPDRSVRRLILQQERGDASAQGSKVVVQAALLAAAASVGVPVPHVLAAGAADGLDPGWLVVERLEGESIPRRLLRDEEWADARAALTEQCARALAAIHTIDPSTIAGLPPRDPLRDPLVFLDGLGEVRPAIELGVRWLACNRPDATSRTTVHGDFRMGNLLVGPDGLRAVLDWELAHAGDPAEDLGWLCARAWRFGGAGRVGGFGDVTALLAGYEVAGGTHVSLERLTWWEAYADVKWAVICALQASAHLSGATRSLELATIGRRVCESEWDLLELLGFAPAPDDVPPTPRTATMTFGRPTATELVEAVREHLDDEGSGESPRTRFEARVARNALSIVERELALSESVEVAHRRRLAELGYRDDAALAAALREGAHDDAIDEVGTTIAGDVRDQLLVANPAYFGVPPAPGSTGE
jgi:aminoglycoside phosphotransferase (APT) family kinase protein